MTVAPPDCLRYPLSAAQRRLWFIARLDPTSCAYHNAHLLRFRGPLDVARLCAALQTVIDRHESLRMRFVFAGEPGSDVVAVVDAAVSIDVPQRDYTVPLDARSDADPERFVAELAREPFDLATGPLIRAGLLRVQHDEHILAIVIHHIISDRWSFGVLVRELAAVYGAAATGAPFPLAPIATSYGQCSRAEAEADPAADAHLAYWRTILAPPRTALDLPTDRRRSPIPGNRGAVVTRTIAPDLARRFVRVGAERKATPFMTYFAAFFVLLQRTTGQTDLLVGTPVAGRARIEREPLIGLFVNTLPVRVQASPEQRFTDVLAEVRGATLGLLAHGDVPFDRLVREELGVRDGSRNPFFDVLFNFHNTPAAHRWPDALHVVTEDIDIGTSRLDLAVVLRPEPDGSLTMRLEFSCDLFERATIETFAAHYCALLESIAHAPDVPITELAIADGREIETIVRDWSRAGESNAAPTPDALTVDRLVARAARLYPDAVALIEDGAPPITYAELERRSNRLAHALRARGVGRDVRVGLYLERSAHAVVAMLATLKAGGAYVPLDPAYPPGRTEAMLEHAEVAIVVTLRNARTTPQSCDVPSIDVDDPAQLHFDSDRPPDGSDDPDRLAYVIFTSGSTGRPKAVGIAHRGMVAFLTRTPYLACTPDDAFLLHAALTFDASVLLWAPLINGARVAIAPAGPFSLHEFARHLTINAITMLDLSPALFHQLVEERIDALRGLRRCTVGGDVLSPAHGARFVHDVPGCRLFNCYGPTETTVAACFYEVSRDTSARQALPIGRPLADARLYVLDARAQPVPIGVAGELWIGGPGVARGYINDPDLTAQRFVPDPFDPAPGARMYRSGDGARWLPDGNLHFLGRLDGQVKIRGFRIEPAEIECALLEHPAVRQAAVVVRGEAAQRELIAYVELRTPGLDAGALRAFLQTQLPAHVIPTRFAVLGVLPKTSSGKLDRAALPAAVPVVVDRPGAKSPTSELEQRLLGMWKALLAVETVGIDDDFFALGGHSLLAARLIGEIEREFQTPLPLAVLFERPTIAHLAHVLQHDPANLNRSPLVALNPDGGAPPLFFLHGSFAGGGYYCLALARRLGADQPLLVMRPHGVDGRALPPTLEAMASECIDTLKAARPHGPYLLGGFCSGGLVALEMARQLVARGERVENLILIDVPNAEPRLRTTLEGIAKLARGARVAPHVRSTQRATLSRLARTVRDVAQTHGKRGLLRRCGAKLQSAFDPRQRDETSVLGAAGSSEARPDVAAAWRRIGAGYVARPYAGRLTILLSDEYRRRPDVHVDQWPIVAPRATIRQIPGEHLTCITDHIEAVAAHIAAALASTPPPSL